MQAPLIDQVVISPDGKTIAALYNNNDRIMVLVKDLTDDNKDPVIINVLNHDVKWIKWANNQRIITGTFVEGGFWDEQYELVVMDKNGDNMRSLFKVNKVGDIIDLLPDDPEHVLVEVWSMENPIFPDVYKVSVGKLSEELRVQKSIFNIEHWITDANGDVKLGIGWLQDKMLIEADAAAGNWKTIIENDYIKDPEFYPLGFGKSNLAYVLSRHEDDKLALYEYDFTTQTFGKQLLKHDIVDIDGIYYSRLNDKIEFATFTLDKQELYFFDDQLGKEYLAVNKALPDTSNLIAGLSADEKRIIVFASRDNNPGSYYLFDREKKTIKYLGSRYPNLDKISLSETKGIKYQARDGMTIYGYLSFPVNRDNKPLPMVVLVHGGPYSRDENKYDPWVQFLTNRGYIVFQPNFRGSTGYGDAYWRGGYRQWGLAMQNDIVDGVKNLIDGKIVDANKICIMGASYGGYAALMGVAKNSDIFCCAISFAGISDINQMMIQERSKGSGNYLNRILIGDDVSERKAASPISYVESINRPVLLAHGTEDKVVNFSQSNNMYKALKGNKKDVTFLKLKDETHNLEDIKNRVEFFQAVEKFLDKNIDLSLGAK